MANYIANLNSKNGDILFPITVTDAIYSSDQVSLADLFNGKVDKIAGKGLSTNDFTNIEKSKLASIADGANMLTSIYDTNNDGVVDKAASLTGSINQSQVTGLDSTFSTLNANIATKVDKVAGKALSENDLTGLLKANYDAAYTHSLTAHATTNNATTTTAGLMSAADKTKLNGIDNNANNYIHPTSGVASGTYSSVTVDVNGHITNGSNPAIAQSQVTGLEGALAGKATSAQGSKADTAVQSATVGGAAVTKSGTELQLPAYPTTLPASDVYAWAKAATKPSYGKGEVGLGNVDNTSDSVKSVASAAKLTTSSTINGVGFDGTSDITVTDSTKIPLAQKGVASGVAELDSTGKVPSSQLPSYVDDVLEYVNLASFPASGESGKIYIATDTNLTYRWSGSGYVEISPSLALGEMSGTAYRGDRGKIAYDHSQALHAPSDATKNVVSRYTATIGTTWTGSAPPFAQQIAVTGILATDYPDVDIVQTGTEATDSIMREAWGKVTRIVAGAGSITVYAEDAIDTAIPIQLKVVR